MRVIADKEYGGERPLYKERGLRLERVTIHPGESSLKETADIEADDCRFEGKYVLWECQGFRVRNSYFAESARSSLWYSSDALLEDCTADAPKLFRQTHGITLRRCHLANAQETLWDCSRLLVEDCRADNADYLGMHTTDATLLRYHQEGNYAFQYGKRIEIRNALLNSKDALWDCEDVAIYDSEINGEYFAWYSRNLRLVRCHITGTQPLCYCHNLQMEDCTLGDDADLCFEYSTINATLLGNIHSIKNPTSGSIAVQGHIGQLIIDHNQKQPANCLITQSNNHELQPTHPTPRHQLPEMGRLP